MAEMTTKEAQELIHPTPVETAPTQDYEMDDYSNVDAFSEGDLEPIEEAAPEPEEAAPATPATPQADWEAIAQKQAEELAQFREEQSKQKKADFDRLLSTKTPEEQVEMLKAHLADQSRAAELDQMRAAEAQRYPLATTFFTPIMERFEMEIDDPAMYSQAMSSLEEKYEGMVTSIVEERVKQEMEKFYSTAGKEWGLDGLGAATPRGLQPRNPVRNQYEQTRKEMAKPGAPKTNEQLTDLIRKREQAKQGRNA